MVGNWCNFLLFGKDIIGVKKSLWWIEHFADGQWNKFLDSAWRQESDLITATFFDIKWETVDHVKRSVSKNSLFIFIHENPDFLTFSELGTNENVSFFPVNVEFAFDLLIDLGSDMERINSLRLYGVWLDIIVIHFVSVSCCILPLSDLFIHIVFINLKIYCLYLWLWVTLVNEIQREWLRSEKGKVRYFCYAFWIFCSQYLIYISKRLHLYKSPNLLSY